MRYTIVIPMLLIAAATNQLIAQTKVKQKPARTTTSSTTAAAQSDEEKAALSALRGYHSVRDSGDKDSIQRYFLEAKVKVDQLPPTPLATKIRDAFAPTLRASQERKESDRAEKYNESMSSLGSYSRGYDANAERKANAEKAVGVARENIEHNRKAFSEFGPAFDAKRLPSLRRSPPAGARCQRMRHS